MPEFGDLKAVAKILGVPWQWLLIGEDGAQLVLDWWRKRQRGGDLPTLRPPKPGAPSAAQSQGPADGAKRAPG